MPRCTTNSIRSAISSRGKSTSRDALLPCPSGALSRHRSPLARWRSRCMSTSRRYFDTDEQGHCLSDQALSFCAPEKLDMQLSLGAASLATIMQMVANGYAVTLLPEVAIDAEVRDERIKLLRFAAPEPSRTIGLAFRRTSPRKQDFVALGRLVVESMAGHQPRPARATTNSHAD